VLGIGFGLGSLAVASGMLCKPRWSWLWLAERLAGHQWSWAATILIGLGHHRVDLVGADLSAWRFALEVLYGAAWVLLPMVAPVRGYLRNNTT